MFSPAKDPAPTWSERIENFVTRSAIFGIAAYVIGRALTTQIVEQNQLSHLLDLIDVGVVMAALWVVIKLIDRTATRQEQAKQEMHKLAEQQARLLERFDDKLTLGIVTFDDAESFYRDLHQEVLNPRVTFARLTAIRREATHVASEAASAYYRDIFKLCKDKHRKFHAQRLVAAPTREMLDWVEEQIELHRSVRGFELYVIPGPLPFTMVNVAILYSETEPNRSKPTTVYLVFTRSPTINDTFGIKISDQPEIATYFDRFYNHIKAHAKDPLENDHFVDQLREELEARERGSNVVA